MDKEKYIELMKTSSKFFDQRSMRDYVFNSRHKVNKDEEYGVIKGALYKNTGERLEEIRI